MAPRSRDAGHARLQRAARRPGCVARSTSRRCPPRWTRSSRATKCCVRRSTRSTASRGRSSTQRHRSRSRSPTCATVRPRAARTRRSRSCASMSRRPFDLARDPQLRASLIRLGDDDHVLLLESHHVSSDAWSRNILMRELSAFYAGGSQRRAPLTLGALPIQYGDYARWQRQYARGERSSAMLAYWRDQLRGAPTLLELPTDRPRPAAPELRGRAARRACSRPSCSTSLRTLSRENGCTLFMTLLAAFDRAARASQRPGRHRRRFADRRPRARRRPKASSATSPTRSCCVRRLDGDPTFLESARARAGRRMLGAFEHQDVPYEKLVLELQRDRAIGAGSAPLFQTMFTLQDASGGDAAAGLDGGAVRQRARCDQVRPLAVMHERAGGLRAAFEFRTDLFDARRSTCYARPTRGAARGRSSRSRPRRSRRCRSSPAGACAAPRRMDATGGTQTLDAETLHEHDRAPGRRSTPDAWPLELESPTGTHRAAHLPRARRARGD